MWNDLLDLIYEAYEQFSLLPLFIEIALTLILVAVLATILSYIVILVKRYKGYVYQKRLAYLSPRIEDMITEQVLLNENLDKDIPVDEIEFDQDAISNRLYKKPAVRQVLIDVLIRYRKNFRGEVGDLLRKLYIDMNLLDDSFKKLSTFKWETKIKALAELTNMGIPISDSTLLPLTNSRNPTLRAASRNAYIQLSKNEPFKFFDIATEPILPWDQLEMFKIITTSKDSTIPNFSRWVSYSNNKSIVNFCFKLIVHYDQRSAIPAVMELLSTKDHYFRANAINCLGKLSAEDAEDKFVTIYNSQPVNCQIEIIKALGRISSGKHLEFLKHEFMYSYNFDIQMSAARSIIKHNTQNSRLLLNELMETINEKNKLIIKHCYNPLIKF